jgi:O-antigen ligase
MGDHESKMTALAYLNTFAGIMIFFSCFWFFSRISDDENRILKFFIFLAFSLMFVKISGPLPQIFSTSFTQEYTTPQGATRLGGFDACVGLGIPALIAYSYDRVNIPRTLFIIALIALGIIGGGRSLMFGVLLTIIIYLILFYKRYSTKFLLACGIVVLATALAAQFVPLPKQIKRISGVTLIESGGFARQDPGRHILFSLYWDIFLENPVFGKGIGVYKEKMSGPLEFIKGELRDGGHGAYLSTLCIFGIVGGIFLGLMLFGGIYRSYKSILANNLQKNAVVYKKLTIFIMLYLLTLASEFTFGGDGYQKPEMYAVIGMLLGITRKEEEVVPATQP